MCVCVCVFVCACACVCVCARVASERPSVCHTLALALAFELLSNYFHAVGASTYACVCVCGARVWLESGVYDSPRRRQGRVRGGADGLRERLDFKYRSQSKSEAGVRELVEQTDLVLCS